MRRTSWPSAPQADPVHNPEAHGLWKEPGSRVTMEVDAECAHLRTSSGEWPSGRAQESGQRPCQRKTPRDEGRDTNRSCAHLNTREGNQYTCSLTCAHTCSHTHTCAHSLSQPHVLTFAHTFLCILSTGTVRNGSALTRTHTHTHITSIPHLSLGCHKHPKKLSKSFFLFSPH